MQHCLERDVTALSGCCGRRVGSRDEESEIALSLSPSPVSGRDHQSGSTPSVRRPDPRRLAAMKLLLDRQQISSESGPLPLQTAPANTSSWAFPNIAHCLGLRGLLCYGLSDRLAFCRALSFSRCVAVSWHPASPASRMGRQLAFSVAGAIL